MIRTFDACGGRDAVEATFLKAARATCDFYIRETPACGIPYWDTGAPGLAKLGDYRDRPADPFNDVEPVGQFRSCDCGPGPAETRTVLASRKPSGERKVDRSTSQAGLTVLKTLLDEPYLSQSRDHEGLILHSVYHRPKGWDYIPPGRTIPCGEASMWGDYHARELALYVERLAKNEPYHTFFGPLDVSSADPKMRDRRVLHAVAVNSMPNTTTRRARHRRQPRHWLGHCRIAR